MNIIKRDGSEEVFDAAKIRNAIAGANAEVPDEYKLDDQEVVLISRNVEAKCLVSDHTVTVEEVQDMVIDQLMSEAGRHVAKKYIEYR